MELPAVFEQDIQSKVINITTRVVIGEEDPIYLSTHSLTFGGQHYKPLLLDIPSMKESVDYESRNFKISNVTLKISNYKYNNERFSDLLKFNPLINEKCEIYWNTQSANSSSDALRIFKGYVRRVSHTDSEVSIQLEDLTEKHLHKTIPLNRTSTSRGLDSRYRDIPIPMAFGVLENAPAVLDAGHILKADSDESIELIYENSEYYQPHPVWGEFTEVNEDGAYTPVRIFEDSVQYITKTPNVKIIHDSDTEVVGFFITPQDHIQYWDEFDEDTPVTQSGTVKLAPFKNGVIELFQIYTSEKPSEIKCHLRSDASINNLDGMLHSGYHDGQEGYETPNRFRSFVSEKLSDDDYDFNSMEYLNAGIVYKGDWLFDYNHPHIPFMDDSANSAQTILKIAMASSPKFSYQSVETQWNTDQSVFIAINGTPIKMNSAGQDYWYNRIIRIFSRTQTANNAEGLYNGAIFPNANGVSHALNTFYLDGRLMNEDGSDGAFHQDFRDIFQFIIDGVPDQDDDYRGYETVQDNVISTIDLKRWADDQSSVDFLDYGGFITIADATEEFGEYHIFIGVYTGAGYHEVGLQGGIGGDWAEIDLLHRGDVEFDKGKDYYLSVTGRREGGNVIRNPIEILKHIAVDELGVGEIDEDSYEAAKAIHSDLKFDFSIKDEIKSKELFQDIAKSTLCYPYFNNQGELTFASYKPSYSLSDFADAKTIKDFDVINFSFNKTKLEQAHTAVKLKYNYNYTTDKYDSSNEFIGTATGIGLSSNEEQLAYNGYSDKEDNILEFESPYIRDDLTAEKIWTYMFRDYQYQHLTCKIKLPLHYIHLDVGDTIKFDKLLGGMRAFGIDYTKVSNLVSDQRTAIYPMFFVTSVSKNLNSIEIEARQIHHLDNSVFDFQAWDYDDFVPEDEPTEDEEIDTVVGFTLDEGYNAFRLIEPYPSIQNVDITHWFEPSAFGLSSFNELLPTDWSSYTSSEIENYKAFEFRIDCGGHSDPEVFYQATVTLKNIAGSLSDVENFELGWEVRVSLGEDDTESESLYNEDEWFNQDRILYISSGNSPVGDDSHTLQLGDGLKKAMSEGLLGFQELGFDSGYDMILTGYEGEYALGDVNNDGTINIMDIIGIINHIFDPGQGTGNLDAFGAVAADFNQDTQVNILDVVNLVQYILGQGDD